MRAKSLRRAEGKRESMKPVIGIIAACTREVHPAYTTGHDYVRAVERAGGLVEAVESADGLALGVQWHPENLAPEHPDHAAVFTWLVDAAAGGALLKR